MNMFNNNNNNNLVSPISAIHVHMGVRSSTKAWSMYMWPNPDEQWLCLPQWQISPHEGGASVAPFLSVLEVLTGLILCRYCAGNHTCCEFLCHVMSRRQGSEHSSPSSDSCTLPRCSLVPCPRAYVFLFSEHTCCAERLNDEIPWLPFWNWTPLFAEDKIPCELNNKVIPSSWVRSVTPPPCNFRKLTTFCDILKTSMMENGVEEGFSWQSDWLGRVSPGFDHYLSKTKCGGWGPRLKIIFSYMKNSRLAWVT